MTDQGIVPVVPMHAIHVVRPIHHIIEKTAHHHICRRMDRDVFIVVVVLILDIVVFCYGLFE